ncbi:hypothetical protein Tco_0377063 [Tanacetum coccineum]
MVAYLKKSEGSEGFHQIVDFLNSSHIKYALTENTSIYESFIKKFWQTASASTLEDGEVGITATIDGQLKTVTEASLRRHLKVLVLETDLKETKKVYSTTFTKLIMKVKKLEKIVKSNKAKRRAKFIVSDDEEDLEDSSKQGRRIADIDQDSNISLVHHDADIHGRYEDISTIEFNISNAKLFSTAGAAVDLLL